MSTNGCVAADDDAATAPSTEGNPKPDWPWKKAKKVAVMMSFSGKNYMGMQRNPGFPTIEEELWKALLKTETVPQEWFDNPQQAFFQRASRTDKGVSALRMVVSLKMLVDEADTDKTVEEINRHLPETIRVHDIKRVTKNFNCKTACDSRTYKYLMPSFALKNVAELPEALLDTEEEAMSEAEKRDYEAKLAESFEEHKRYRLTEDVLAKANDVLSKFVGSRFFHNYTSGKLPLEPSSRRYITKFSLEKFERAAARGGGEELEMVMVEVRGQSFMLHQIRKMIGLMLSVVRGACDEEKIEETWGTQRVDIPRAPGLGLVLNQIHYDTYNRRYGSDGIHQKLEWSRSEEAVERWSSDNVHSDIVETELAEKSMLRWLQTLRIHTFEARHFEGLEGFTEQHWKQSIVAAKFDKSSSDGSPERKKAKL